MNVPAIAIHFADELSRARALTDKETDMLCTVLKQQQEPRRAARWTQSQDRELQRLAATMNAPEIAATLKRTPWSIRRRLFRLRKRQEMGRG